MGRSLRNAILILVVTSVSVAGSMAAQLSGGQATAPPDTAVALYRQLRTVGLSPDRVYNIRDAVLTREDLRVAFNDGTIAFTEDVQGRVTGAFFEGEGEVLLIPPDLAERGSLALFTGAAVLSEKFTTAYLRFNDSTVRDLAPALRKEANPEFIQRFGETARTLADSGALRLLASYLNELPKQELQRDQLLSLRLKGERLGIFDVVFDTLAPEQIIAGQVAFAENGVYYDLLTSFPMRSARQSGGGAGARNFNISSGRRARVLRYAITATVEPPSELEAETTVTVDVQQPGQRMLVFELSRFLKVDSVRAHGKQLTVMQNEALEGSQLARTGNDLVAVISAEPLPVGQVELTFHYAGSVLQDAGSGLVYVGARGIWYPGFGFHMADYDMEFRVPSDWTLAATGRRISQSNEGREVISRWRSERSIPAAGFNVGRYIVASAQAGATPVESYAAQGVENSFPQARIEVGRIAGHGRTATVFTAPAPSPNPAQNAQVVADRAARAVEAYSERFGPFPFPSLALTQLPGRNSQSWPGLILLSSYSFVPPAEIPGRREDYESIFYEAFMQTHEVAHQWWGGALLWRSYRDQWIMEALANYSALLLLEQEKPGDARLLLDYYRHQLLAKGPKGKPNYEAGAVTLGPRLISSQFPSAYDFVAYGRGAWLFHMLRHMFRDAALMQNRGKSLARANADPDAVFLQALRTIRDRNDGKELSTDALLRAFEEVLPAALQFEGRKSLDWFAEYWVNGTAIPELELKDVKITARGKTAVATGTLVQKNAPELQVTSVPIYAELAPDQTRLAGRVFADGAETSLRIPVPAGTKRLLLDPNRTVLRR